MMNEGGKGEGQWGKEGKGEQDEEGEWWECGGRVRMKKEERIEQNRTEQRERRKDEKAGCEEVSKDDRE